MDELQLMQDLGEIKAEIRNLKDSQDKQGQRIGALETNFTTHLQVRSGSGGNNWRSKATYAGGGGAFIAFMEFLRHVLEH